MFDTDSFSFKTFFVPVYHYQFSVVAQRFVVGSTYAARIMARAMYQTQAQLNSANAQILALAGMLESV